MTKTTAMMMTTGLMMAAPACGEQFTKSMTVPAPSAPLATTEETVPTPAPMRPAPEVVQRRARAIEVKVL